MNSQSAGPCFTDINVIKWIHYPCRWKTLFLNVFSPFFKKLFIFKNKCDVWRLHSHLSHKSSETTMRFGRDLSVCVLLTDRSHITISMATRAVAIATASSQSVLQLDVRAVAAWVTIWGSRQVSLTFTKVNPPFLPSSLTTSLLLISAPPPLEVNKTLRHCPYASKSCLATGSMLFFWGFKHLEHPNHLSLFVFSVISLFPSILSILAPVTWYAKQIGTLTAHRRNSQAESVITSHEASQA